MAGCLRRLFGAPEDRARKKGKDVYSELRNRALTTPRRNIGIPEPERDAPVWGLLMETGYESGSSTLVALLDGSTSLYLSSGGGVIGGHAHEKVRRANAEFLRSANRFRSHLLPAREFPLPSKAQVIFYALTDVGVLTLSAEEQTLSGGHHPLSPLFHAGHDVITELRLLSDKGQKEKPATNAAGGDVNRPLDESGLTVLMVAAHQGQAEAVENLILQGARIEARDHQGYTPLMFASNAGQAGCVAKLIAAKADVNARDNDGSTPLMFAAQHGHDPVVTLLLSAGADPNAVGKHGLSPIGFAEQNGHVGTLQLLRSPSRKPF